jgi:hypothetical protein
LTDEDKRKVYDETGELDGGADQMMSEESFEFWDNYFRSLFPKVTVEDIESFGQLYKGSTGEVSSDYNEKQDILDAYTQREGRFDHIMESVMLAEEEDEERISAVIVAAIAAGDLASTPAFEKHLLATRTKRERESKGKGKSKGKSKRGTTEPEGESASSSSSSSTSSTKARKSQKKSKTSDSMDDLAARILGNRSSQQSAMRSIFSRYGDDEEEEEEKEGAGISEADFERVRASLGAKEATGRGGGGKKKKTASKNKNSKK